MPSIIVSRRPALTLLFAKMDLYVDGSLQGRLSYGESLKILVEPGAHEVMVGETITRSEVHSVVLKENQSVFFVIDFDNSKVPRYWLDTIAMIPSEGSDQSCSRCGDFAEAFYEYNNLMCGPCLERFLEPDRTERVVKIGAVIVIWTFLVIVLLFIGCLVYAYTI